MAGDRILIEIDADSSDARRGLRETGAGIRRLGDETQRASRAANAFSAAGAKQRQTLGDIANVARTSARNLGLVTAAVAGHVIKTGAAFEQSMARVEAVTQATDQQMARLNKTAKKLGADTKYSAGQAADAMYELSSAGFSVDETIRALPGTLSLAASSGIELRDAAEISANALRGFRLQAKDSGHVADVMAAAVAKSSLEMNDLQFSMKYIGPIASTTGQSLEQMTAALSLMGDAGIKGEQAGTTLRGALVRLTAPTKQTVEGLDALNINARDLTGPKGLKPLAEIIEIVAKKSEGMDQASRNAALAQVFGTEALSGMVAVIDQGAPKLEKLTRAYERSDGAAKKSADTMNDTVKGSFEALTGSIETVEISLYERFQEPLKNALKEGAVLVNTEGRKIEDWLDRITSTQEFKGADLAGQIGILVREGGEEFEKLDIPAKLGEAFSDAIPHIAEAAKDGAVIAAKAFGQGFINADPIGRLVLATWLLSKTGGLAAFRAMGKQTGAATVAGAATGVTAGAAGFKGSLVAAAKSAAPAAAAAFAIAYGPEVAKKLAGNLSDKTQDFDLPKNRKTFSSMPLLGPHLGDALDSITKAGGAEGKLKAFGDTAERTFKKLKAAGDSRGLATLADDARKMAREFPNAARELSAFAGAVDSAAKSAAGDFKNVATLGGKNLSTIKQAAADAGFEIKQRLGGDTAAGKQALSNNMRGAAAAIKKSMDAGVISTKTGTAEIERLMRQALGLYGIKGKEATRYLNDQDTKTGKSDKGTSSGMMGAARGGFFLGSPTAKGRDSIPMMVNGQPVIAAEGEYVGIFNRHQQQTLNGLARQGGYRGLADVMAKQGRPHHMAGGGIIGLGRQLQEQGYQVGEHPAFGGVRGRHAENSYHYRGQAIDVNADGKGQAYENQRLDALNARLKGMPGIAELLWRVAGHFDHLHVAMGGGGGGPLGNLGAGAKAQRLKRVMWDGPGGALGKLGQRGLDAVLGGAQSRLDAIAASMGGDLLGEDAFTGGGGATSAGGKFDRAALEALWKRAGGDPGMARLMAAIALAESSGNPDITNSIGARGLWQVIPSTARAFGFDHRLLTDPLLNAKAAVAIHKGQGLGAWEAYTRGMHAKYMARGGIMAAAGGLTDKARKTGDDRKARKQLKQSTARSKAKARRRGRGLTHKFPDVWLDRIESFTGDGGKLGVWERLLGQMQREHQRTDEDGMLAALDEQNPDGTYKISQEEADRRFKEIVQAHVGELGQQYTLADQMVSAYENPDGVIPTYAKALDRIRTGITERKTRERELVASAQANREEIKQTQKAYFAEKKKKKPSKAELARLAGRLDTLRDRRFQLIGTRETTGSLNDVNEGQLGQTRRGLASFRETLPDVERGAAAAPLDLVDKRADRQDILDEIKQWGERAMAARIPVSTDPAGADDNGLKDLYKQQRDDALRDLAVQGKQFGVFQGMAPLVGQRLVGAFSHGIDRVPETGLAYVHKDERILPQDYGPYGADQRNAGGTPVTVQLTFGENSGQLVRLVDARVNGAVAKVSQDMGRRQRMLTVAPGGR